MSGQAAHGGRVLGPGAMVASYRIEERIGRGGMAHVFRAVDQRLHRQVALKVLAPGLTRDQEFRTRFVRESEAAAAVDHPNVLPVYEAGESAGHLFIAMRFVGGGDTRGYLRRTGRLTPGRACDLIAQAAAALDAAHHRGLVHRDVKPANMLLEAGSAAPHVYLADFGVSKQLFAEHLTATGQLIGTPDYVAPEQIQALALDGRADQYSLACVAFELLCGAPPFRRGQLHAIIYAQLYEPPPPLSEHRPELPAEADGVLARALAKAPEARYASCTHFSARLTAALGRSPARTGPAAPLMPPGPGEARLGAEPPTKRRDGSG